jgi:hypothetical protein
VRLYGWQCLEVLRASPSTSISPTPARMRQACRTGTFINVTTTGPLWRQGQLCNGKIRLSPPLPGLCRVVHSSLLFGSTDIYSGTSDGNPAPKRARTFSENFVYRQSFHHYIIYSIHPPTHHLYTQFFVACIQFRSVSHKPQCCPQGYHGM